MVVIMDVDVIFFRLMQEKSFVIQIWVVELSKAALEIIVWSLMELYFQVMIHVTNAIVLMEKYRVLTRSVLIPMLNASQANTAKTVVNVERMAIV